MTTHGLEIADTPQSKAYIGALLHVFGGLYLPHAATASGADSDEIRKECNSRGWPIREPVVKPGALLDGSLQGLDDDEVPGGYELEPWQRKIKEATDRVHAHGNTGNTGNFLVKALSEWDDEDPIEDSIATVLVAESAILKSQRPTEPTAPRLKTKEELQSENPRLFRAHGVPLKVMERAMSQQDNWKREGLNKASLEKKGSPQLKRALAALVEAGYLEKLEGRGRREDGRYLPGPKAWITE
jgi:hypothetical protein